MTIFKCFASIILMLGITTSMYADTHPLIGSKAPELKVDNWHNLDQGKKLPRLADLRGKVVYLYCYQNWCPGCHKYGFPTLQTLASRFNDRDKIVFLAIQTVFEGFESNSESTVETTRERYELDIPFGHDDGNGRGSEFMKDYMTGGTPWHIIIDAKGIVRFCGFHVDPEKVVSFLDNLME